MIEKNLCCGCSACCNVCPKNCISMQPDSEGFLYPVIDKQNCINCGLCEKVCPALHGKEKSENVSVYACKHKDRSVQRGSSSGGVFSALAEYVVDSGGIVFGVRMNSEHKAVHDFADSREKLLLFRGSKYVQSELGDSYRKAKEFLDEKRTVLFSGTSCQIAGLKAYLQKPYDNLVCVDVICHGVPSPLVFEKYIKEREKQYNQKIDEISFRDKTEGWADFSMKISFENDTYRKKVSEDVYLRGFVLNLYLRESCYDCKYKSFTCGSDISLADFWGIKRKAPDFYDENGVSLVCVNTEAGKKLFSGISDVVDVKEMNLSDALECNKAIVASPVRNKRREKFFGKLGTKDVVSLTENCLKPNLKNRINVKTKKLLNKILK